MKKIISIVLILCLIFNTSSFYLFANAVNNDENSNNNQLLTMYENDNETIDNDTSDNRSASSEEIKEDEAELNIGNENFVDNEKEVLSSNDDEEKTNTDDINSVIESIEEKSDGDRKDENEIDTEIDDEMVSLVESKENENSINAEETSIVNTEGMSITNGIITNEEDIATESDIINENIVEIEAEDKIKENIDIATISDVYIDTFDELEIATYSELNTYKFNNVSTTSETNHNNINDIVVATASDIRISTLSNIEKILYSFNKVEDSAILSDNKITLLKDAIINDKIEITDSITFDLNNYNIKSNYGDTTFIIKGKSKNELIDVTFLNNESLKRMSLNDRRELQKNNINFSNVGGDSIKVENANLVLKNINVFAATRSTVLNVTNANVDIDNAALFGGVGFDYAPMVDASNGEVAVKLNYSNDNYKFNFMSGFIKGGTGGKNNIDTSYALGGTVLLYIMNDKPRFTKFRYTANGVNGTVGSGNGGSAFTINDRKWIKNIIIKTYGISGGDGGKTENDERVKNVLYGANYPSYYDLRVGESVGTTYTNVSPLKTQYITSLCGVFALMASAECYMMKNYRSYLDEVYTDDATYEETKQANFSETHFSYYTYEHPNDPLSNAGSSRTTFDWGGSFYDYGYMLEEIAAILSKRGIADARIAPSQPIFELMGTTLTKNSSYANQYVARLKNLEFIYINQGERGTSVGTNMLKQIIMDNAGAYITIGGEVGWDLADIDSNYVSEEAKTYYENKYARFMNDTTSVLIPGDYGGHAIYIVGWDDNFPKEFWPAECRPSIDGAFIIKNSWAEWDFMSYEYADYGGQVMAITYAPTRDLQNFYYYDAGGFYDGIISSKKIANVFETKKECETLKAVTFIPFSTSDCIANIKVYKIPSGKTINDIKDTNLVAYKNGFSLYEGVDYIDLSDFNIIMKKGEKYAVVIEKVSGEIIYGIDEAVTISYEKTSYSTIMGNSYDYEYKWVKSTNYNYCIKMITNDYSSSNIQYVSVSFDKNGGSGTMAQVSTIKNSSYTIPNCSFYKSKNTFQYWKDDAGNKYYAGSIIKITADLKLTAVWQYTGGGGGGGGSGGGGGGGGGTISGTQFNNANTIERAIGNVTKVNNPMWSQVDNNWHLNIDDGTPAMNAWYSIIDSNSKTNYYKFNEVGNMLTGLVDYNGSDYFLNDDATSSTYGALSFGWKLVSNTWKYFGSDGRMLASGKTFDGYILDSSGSYVGAESDLQANNILTTTVNGAVENLVWTDAIVYVDPIWTYNQELIKQQELAKQQLMAQNEELNKMVVAANNTETALKLPIQIMFDIIGKVD